MKKMVSVQNQADKQKVIEDAEKDSEGRQSFQSFGFKVRVKIVKRLEHVVKDQ
jgi:uncharacterized protein YbcV (DUF1398 family)